MALSFEDKRARYKGLAPFEFVPGTPKAGNPVPPKVNQHTPAIRSDAPRENFRKTTAPPPPEPPPVIPTPYVEPVPEWEEL